MSCDARRWKRRSTSGCGALLAAVIERVHRLRAAKSSLPCGRAAGVDCEPAVPPGRRIHRGSGSWPRSPRSARAAGAPLLLTALLLTTVGCATSRPAQESTIRELPSSEKAPRAGVVATYEGRASWYGKEQNGHATASGERFDMHALTAAHRTLHMNTRVRVTNLRNGRQVTVRINDRGPYGRGRIIDLSYAAAVRLDMLSAGVVPVRLEVLAP